MTDGRKVGDKDKLHASEWVMEKKVKNMDNAFYFAYVSSPYTPFSLGHDSPSATC